MVAWMWAYPDFVLSNFERGMAFSSLYQSIFNSIWRTGICWHTAVHKWSGCIPSGFPGVGIASTDSDTHALLFLC